MKKWLTLSDVIKIITVYITGYELVGFSIRSVGRIGMSPSISISTVKFQLFHAHIPVLTALLQGCLIHATREYGCSVQTARVYGPSTRPKFTGSVESAPVKTGREHGS